MEIKSILKQNRPDLSESSLVTYNSILHNLHFGLYPDERVPKMKDFLNSKLIINYLKDKPIGSRKTILSALYVLTKLDVYKNDMLDDIKEYREETDKQEKTETQAKNWATKEQIIELLNKYKLKANRAYKYLHDSMYNKHEIDKPDGVELQHIQDYIILCLLSGEYIPPRRAKDYCDFRIKCDSDNCNYLKGNKLYFRSYKGSDKKGLQIVQIPITLKRILTKWFHVNPSQYLLFDGNENQMTNVKLNQRLNKIFGQKIAINALRHTYLTDKHKDTINKMDSLSDDMKMMGSSILQAKVYIKK
jgi:hypothetical protein